MKKSEGSILIEVMASILMLSIAGIFVLSTSLKCLRQYENRITEEKLNRAVNMLIKEFKYNKSKEELEEVFCDNDVIYFKYDENIDNKLFDSDIFCLESGNDIEIQKISEDNMGNSYKIKVNIDNENIYYEREEEFYKSWWMDEI